MLLYASFIQLHFDPDFKSFGVSKIRFFLKIPIINKIPIFEVLKTLNLKEPTAMSKQRSGREQNFPKKEDKQIKNQIK